MAAGGIINRERLLALFREMVDLYSPSGKEEELAECLQDYMQAGGLTVKRQPVDETRFNLLASSGHGTPDMLFLGHIDTVPAFDFDQYGFEMRNEQCHGLGTADMKGGCAAMIEAFLAVHAQGRLPDNVLLALVVGEEEAGDGTQILLSSQRFSHALVAEPTDLHPCLQHYGYVEMLVKAFGYRRHAAMSGRETNAIRAMLHLLLHLEEHIEAATPDIVLNIRDLHSSESGFAVPDRCTAAVDLHLPPAVPAAPFAEEMKAFVEASLARSGATRHEIEFPTCTDGYQVAPTAPLIPSLQQLYQDMKLAWRPIPFRSHSDANLLRDAGCRPIVLGPGLLAKAHTMDESVSTEQVVTAAQLYAGLLQNIFSHGLLPGDTRIDAGKA